MTKRRPQTVRKCSRVSWGVAHPWQSKMVTEHRSVVTFLHLVRLTKVPTVTGIGGVLVAKRKTVITVGFVLGRRISRVPTVTKIGGVLGRETQNRRHSWVCVWLSQLKSANNHRDRRDPGRETQTCRHFWTSVGSSHLKSANRHKDWGCPWSRNVEPSSLLGSCLLVAAQKWQQSQASAWSWSRNAELSTFLDLRCVVASQKCRPSQRLGGFGRETQNCRHFWIRVRSSHRKRANTGRDGGSAGKTRRGKKGKERREER